MKRIAYVVQTPKGFLGTRRYSFKAGTTTASDTSFQFARIFTRNQDAQRSCGRQDKVLPVVVTAEAA